MITLYVYKGLWGLPSLSPFCTKTMVYMKLAGVEHTAKPGDPRKAPMGKLPYIKHPGGIVADSGEIEAWLKAEHGDPLDGDLTPAERAQGHLLRRTCEESLYWALVFSRWQDEAGWAAFLPELKALIPAPNFIKPLIMPKIRKGALVGLHGQGYGRHSREKVFSLGMADLDAFAAALGDRDYLFRDHPTSFDAILFSFMWGLKTHPVDTPLRQHLTSNSALMGFLERMEARYSA